MNLTSLELSIVALEQCATQVVNRVTSKHLALLDGVICRRVGERGELIVALRSFYE